MLNFTAKASIDNLEFIDFLPIPGTITDLDGALAGGKTSAKENNRIILDIPYQKLAAAGKPLPEVEPFRGWLTPEAAWVDAQSKKQNMILFFYSPNVDLSNSLNTLMESDKSAARFLSGYSAARVDVTGDTGKAIAKQYGIYKIPGLLVVAPDAKSFKRLSPDNVSSWLPIEKELSLK